MSTDPDRERVRTAAARDAERADRAAAGDHADIWKRYAAFTASRAWTSLPIDRQAVYANLVGLALLGDAEDLLTLASLIEVLGPEQLARIQGDADAAIGLNGDFPLATRAVRALCDQHGMAERLRDAGTDADLAADVATRNHRHIAWMLLAGVERVETATVVETTEQLTELVDDGNLSDWRTGLSAISASPWGPAGADLVVLARRAGRDVVASIIEEYRFIYRAREDRRERETVAREIRRLVALSGMTQRDFAAYVGTSASRLSTYVAGKVTPSAAMLLRIRRAANSVRGRGQGP
jgi:hypothetical protein